MATLMCDDIKYQTLKLLQEYQQSGNIELRNQIVKLNLGLVRKEAHHWAKQCNEGYDDLLQVGSIGLLRAIERFAVDKGNAFSSFATPYIRGEIQHYLRDKSSTVRIPRRWVDLRKQSINFIREFRTIHRRQPSDQEIAQSLDVSVSEWLEINLAHQNREPISLDLCVGSDSETSTSLGDMVPDPQYHSFQLAMEDQLRLQQALGQLEDQTRKILEFVFLHDLTQKEAADLLDVSVVTVSRRVKKGVDLLRKIMGAGD